MTIETVIIEKYKKKGLLYFGELLLKLEDALDFINDCKQNNLIIIGMNFWINKNNNLVEINSADFSSISERVEAPDCTTKEAKQLIQNGLPDNASWVSFIIRSSNIRHYS